MMALVAIWWLLGTLTLDGHNSLIPLGSPFHDKPNLVVVLGFLFAIDAFNLHPK